MGKRCSVIKKCVLGVMTLALLLPGCGKADKAEADSGRPEPKQTNDSLTISVWDMSYDKYASVFEEYKKLYPDVKVNLTTYSYDSQEDAAEKRKKTAAELMAGDGNDLYLMACAEFYDIQKVKESGAFEDLTVYMEKDDEWKKEDYLETIFETEKDGTCFVLPYSISVGFLGTTRTILDETGIALDKCKSYGEQVACMKAYSELYPERVPVVPRGSYYTPLVSLEFVPWKDEKNISLLDSETFREACNMQKAEAVDMNKMMSGAYPDERDEFWSEKNSLCASVFNCPDFKALSLLGGNEGGILVPTLLESGQPQAMTTTDTAAVSANSPNKENAWNFIKLLMGDDFQRKITGSLPVKKTILDEWFENEAQTCVKDTVLIDGVVCPGVSREQVNQAKEAVLSAKLVNDMGYGFMERYSEIMQPFFDGKKELDACISELKDYMEIYYSE
jgi:ABC-type glycerol-3-phosphate transport system substrate-binding protein